MTKNDERFAVKEKSGNQLSHLCRTVEFEC